MIRKIILSSAIFCIIALPSFGANEFLLEWKIPQGERLELVRTAGVKTFINRKLTRTYEERNIVDLTCYKSESSSFSVQGDFSIFSREPGTPVFRLERKEYSDFIISQKGEYTVPDRYIMPNVRDIPVFPSDKVGEGAEWKAQGSIIFDNFSPPLKVVFPVQYRLVKIDNRDGKNIARIQYDFSFENEIPSRKGVSQGSFGGKYSGTTDWDIERNRPVNGTDSYKVGFLYPDGSFMEMHMNIGSDYRTYSTVKPQEKEKEKAELKKELEDKKGITVDSDDRGLVLRMGEVLFDFDSAGLRGDTKKTLDAVTDIIKKKYPDREIIVEGHTDNTGSRGYNQNLSEKRAAGVADYLKKGVNHDKLSYRGYGPEHPIGDNKTKEGQAKNRRVEIVIKVK
jgi:outer membrane protein OmpA-like peptidoglycan-associated protein